MTDFGTCQAKVDHRRIVLKENKSCMTFVNNNHLELKKVCVDGCVITEGLRCDYLIIDNTGKEYFVELKGQDIQHAVKQIIRTIECIGEKDTSKFSFIVSTRCPLIDSEIQTLKLMFKRKYKTLLIIKNIYCEYQLS